MSKTVFPFDDIFRITFSGSFLPSQSKTGEIIPGDVSDPHFEKFNLQNAPVIPSWRQKVMRNSSTSFTPSNASETSSTETTATDHSVPYQSEIMNSNAEKPLSRIPKKTNKNKVEYIPRADCIKSPHSATF
ncbi:hypothetical protein GCK72_023542 [Caenorhabditis remanei]|uniref:Uncharacterized protein n=1 Tax=Caenorhabditis remanei TaxID=31234 RepID=A0A6A5FX07_CAERE|nr:hypothetical protein GCK72_023542 [Caenorhabditis remanei]KAF1747083.1 hypothetical protein GCK72_023542 [Caenorhabditis remanei]